MRWRFVDPKNHSEAVERNVVIVSIDSWWSEFQGRTDQIAAAFSKNHTEWDLPEWMAQNLQRIESRLMWEFGPARYGVGHRLTITAEFAHQLRPLVQVILERAPVLPAWEFYGYRLAEDVETACLAVKARTGHDITDFKVKVSCGRHQRIDLTYIAPAIADPEDQSARNAAFVATEELLGEECLNRWIGAINVASMPRSTGLKSLFGFREQEIPHLLRIDRLNETVASLIASIREQLPPRPHLEWVADAQWTIWELKPKNADDYFEQQDLLVGKSANPTQWIAGHAETLFSSERFSRCGETFCYVKLDGSNGLSEEGFADKSEIEDALDAVLKPDKLGCHIGGGTGLRYSYIDLALSDVNKGIEVIRQRLQAGKVPKRAWIQFYDSDLAAEWVGVYDDSPPPPLPFG